MKDTLDYEVGLIGTGLMGFGLGINLLKAGYKLHIFKHKNDKNINILENNGAKVESSKKELAQKCNVIVLCLPNSNVVEDTIIGNEGILEWLKPQSIIIDCSTSDPSSTCRISNILSEKKVSLLDVPMNKGPKDALEGKLNLMVGGDFERFKHVKPIIDSFSENVFYIGSISSGHRLKLLNNYISMAFTSIVISAIAYAKIQDIDVEKLNEVMSKGSNYIPALPLMISWIEKKEPVLQFSIENAYKDLQYFKQSLKGTLSNVFLLDALLDIFSNAVQKGFGDEMLPELFQIFKIQEE